MEEILAEDHTATVVSLEALLKPHSIAVVGASRSPDSIGNKLFHNMLLQEFKGIVYPVNPNAEAIASVKAYPSVLEVPGEIDLAVIITPAATVKEIMAQCGRKGVKGVIVISAGFGEGEAEGEERQKEILNIARNYKMRLVGPNCMGIINTDPQVDMNATFSPVYPPIGNIAFATQSGALGLAILEYAKNLNIGLSTFVSIGNRADVSSNDLLEYWMDDPATDVILLYLESFGNPKKFSRIARSVTPYKPVVVVKSGRTPAGSRAAASHTGALATAEVASEALFEQTGIIRVNTLEELFDVASLLAHQPVPSGKRVAILTNGGGPGILTADSCSAHGLELPALSGKTIAELRKSLRTGASFTNPIDMTAEATADQYEKSLHLLAQDEGIDIVIVIFIPPIVTKPEAVAGAIREVAPEFRQQGKTLVASFIGSRGASIELCYEAGNCVPSFAFPEDTATAIAKAYEYGEWLKRPKGVIPQMNDIFPDTASEVVKSVVGRRSTEQPIWLDNDSVTKLLDSYGIRIVPSRSAKTAAEAVRAAQDIGFPVVMKLSSATIQHKTEVGGIALDLRTPMEVERAFAQIKEHLANLGRETEMQGVTIQKMIRDGIEIIVGVTQDPSFGPLIMFGLGGTQAELFQDVTFRIHPLTDLDAREMIRSVKAYRLLEGWRGSQPADMEALQDLLLRISAMAENIPSIQELDLNPVKVLGQREGYLVVDARVLVS